MEEYRVMLARPAIEDLQDISWYVERVLKEPKTAEKLENALEEGIMSLAVFPSRCPLLVKPVYHRKGIRRLLVQNYGIFYMIDEERHVVTVVRVLSNRRDWKNFLDSMFES